MNRFCIAILFFAVALSSRAQIVNIPDVNLKNALVNTDCVINYLGEIDIAYIDGFYYYANRTKVDTNGDGEIQVLEAEAVENLILTNDGMTSNGILSLDGLQSFSNLKYLNMGNNSALQIDVLLNSIEALECENNNLSQIDLFNVPNLRQLNCSNNLITALDVSSYNNLKTLFCSANQIETLDFANNPMLYNLNCSNNQLLSLNIKNGSVMVDRPCILEPESSNILEFYNNPSLAYICHDLNSGLVDGFCEIYEETLINNKLIEYNNTNTVANSYCSFFPAGEFYVVQGNAKLDIDNNGCSAADLAFPNLQINYTNGTISGSSLANTLGNYFIPVAAGNYTFTQQLENANYFNVSPSSFTLDFPTNGSPLVQDFCITPNGTKNDVEIMIVPLEQARPGFDTDYELLIRNKGNTTLSGDFSLIFDDNLMNFISANPVVNAQSIGNLTWNYNNLPPLTEQSVIITMNINAPTDTNFPVNADDILNYLAIINPVNGDESPVDNQFNFFQTVVNSFDPNDKRCLQGETISPEQVGDYVHYIIRFENTGTASAVNVVIKDEIDILKYDISSLVAIQGSHDFVTNIRDNNVIEFIFENINLSEDDTSNDGFIVFKIKTQPTLVLGDTFTNDAEIYFDFNAPIITNNTITTVALLEVDKFNEAQVSIYPNPVKNKLSISSKNSIKSIELYDIKGRSLMEYNNIGLYKTQLDLNFLYDGIYFVKIIGDNSFETLKIVKE